jgi:polyisoprenoid-binding protein YceI
MFMRLSTLPAAMLTLLLITGATPALAKPETYKIDPDHAVVGFLVDHVGFAKVLGMFRKIEGSFVYDAEKRAISDVRVVVQTESVYTNHRKRDEHLTGPDFLNAGEFPEMVFTAANAEATGDNTGKLSGSLQLVGGAHPLTLDITLNKAAEHPLSGGAFSGKSFAVGISARGTFKRSPYGMKYGVDNGWVGDDVELIIEFEALRQ